jgi:arabinose-5-phosphate isomerase
MVKESTREENGSSAIKSARFVFEREIEGIRALDEWLGDDFLDAIHLILGIKGRVILSGMGKSGHIGNKIAATLASTGVPAIFVHPGEASHGDLGMITQDDVVVLLSNSGETIELRDIIEYCKRFAIPLIGIVRRKTSVLVDAADVALILPEVPEACDVEAPTTSTTMMLALGDAIAVALLNIKQFSKEDFNVFHPGGNLGAAFTMVRDLMHENIPLVSEDVLMSDVLIEMTAKGFGCSGVVDGSGVLTGVITDGDLRRHMDSGLMAKAAGEVMTENPLTIEGNSLASAALAVMEKRAITSLFVLKEQKPVGIIHIHDLLRAGIA